MTVSRGSSLQESAKHTGSRLMDLREAADRAGVSLSTARKWAGGFRAGPVCVKLGRSVRIRESDFEAWIESNVIGPSRRAQ